MNEFMTEIDDPCPWLSGYISYMQAQALVSFITF